ncbi:NADP-dependent oxidoreductase [Mycobacterium sp. NBC_00419]|uniref:NADP-dependent oxidoreductase n=1 Tax=Mycobacterium sp. NBC_00419 TaxID=2975989 RepID=UPI002E23C54D
MPRAVKFTQHGDIDVLEVVEVPRPVPAAGQVLVEMKAAGINPGEASIRKGLLESVFPTTFPSGEGSDIAGVIAEVGPGVDGYSAGDEIIGFTETRSSHADLVLLEVADLVARPATVPWEVGGALYVAGTTAYAAVEAVSVAAGDVVVVSGAAGGVGSIAVQLAVHRGAKVIGLASAANHEWLAGHGVIPVAYGDGVAESITSAAGGKVDAFIDTFGADYIRLALNLGIAPDRIDTIINFADAAEFGVKAEGNSAANNARVLGGLVDMIAAGDLDIPIASVYPLAEVREAYRELEQRRTRGKIVLVP